MAELWRECIFGFRQFRRSPGLAASVAVTIGLGVGANLAVFALLSDVFLPADGLSRRPRTRRRREHRSVFLRGKRPRRHRRFEGSRFLISRT